MTIVVCTLCFITGVLLGYIIGNEERKEKK